MTTELVDPRFTDLDAWPTEQAVDAMWQGQMDAAAAIKAVVPALASASDAAAARLGQTGRLIYAGAGTSGRIAVQDGAELLPTFGWPSGRTVFALAGGQGALIAAVEDAEDDEADGAAQIVTANAVSADVVIGVSASGSTPFTLGAIREARSRGALTIGLACNPGSALLQGCDHPILLATGSEVLAGSTRMKAGTAQKIALNLISTAIMIRLGRVYKGQMVDMRPTNAKLRKRAVEMVAGLAGCSEAEAAEALVLSGGKIKLAIVVASGDSPSAAKEKLERAGGNLRKALANI
jgi:N-acetylmuramic acid 6-phosphate etherase